jgi:hypothetical protein
VGKLGVIAAQLIIIHFLSIVLLCALSHLIHVTSLSSLFSQVKDGAQRNEVIIHGEGKLAVCITLE